MKRLIIGSFLGACLLFLAAPIRCQDKPNPAKDVAKSTEAQAEGPQVKVQIVFAEYEGDKKVKSLPYTMLIQANRTGKLRIGSRVPVATGGDKGGMQFQYIDVGTNLDCSATPAQDGRYQLRLSLERSWVEGNVPVAMEKSATASAEHNDSLFRQPIIHQFRFDNAIFLRDGQTLETNFATDPASGKVIKVEVTLNVLK
jgi:Bacterial type II and III secretion system protein